MTSRQPLAALRGLARTAVHGKRNQFAALFGIDNGTPYVKDGINDYIVHGIRRR